MKTYRLAYNYENNILDIKNYYSSNANDIVKKIKELNLKYYDIDFYNSNTMDNYKPIMTVENLKITINHAFFKATFKKLL